MPGNKIKRKQRIEREGRYGKFKSKKSYRLVFVKVPGGRTVTQYRKKKPSKAKCAGCGAVLSGVPRERPYKMQNMSKTQKRPERPFGGYYCSKCTKKAMIKKARSEKK